MALNTESNTMRADVGKGTINTAYEPIEILGACSYEPEMITLYELYKMGVRGGDHGTNSEISTAEDFLQRPQQIVEWRRAQRKRCKEYIRSIIKGNGKLDNIVIVPIKDVYSSLQEKEVLVDTKAERDAIKDSLKLVKSDMKKGSAFYCIDGQNRIFQAIVPFFKNKYALDTGSFPIKIDGELVSLSGKSYNKFPDPFKEWFNNIELILVKGTKGDIDGFTDSLIWKNEGIPWTGWMKTLTKNFHSKYARQLKSLAESEGPVLELFNKMTTNQHYIKDVRGFEYLSSELLLWMLHQSWPNDKTHKAQFSLSTEKLDVLVGDLKSYLRELGVGCENSKAQINNMVIKNYVMLRFALDNPKLFPNIDIPYIKIELKTNFVYEYKIWHELMKKDDPKPPKSGPRWPNNFVESLSGKGGQKVPDSYVWGNSDTAVECIEARIRLLCDRIRENMETFLDDGIVVKKDPNKMAGLAQVMEYNDRKDSEGNVIDILDKEEYERGHIVSGKHGGSGDLDNIKPEKKSRNRSYQEVDH